MKVAGYKSISKKYDKVNKLLIFVAFLLYV